jgi:prophage maintenance system killer protein
MNLLESSAEQPFQGGFGVEFYPTIYDKAACLFFSIAGGHLFTNGNKRTAVLALDQFLLGNAVYLALSNEEIKVLAEETASYGERGENQANVRQMLSTEIKRGSVPFSGIRPSDPKFYRRMHKLKNLIRSHRLNQAGVRPQQAIFENRY